jgi:hypothetical protein
MLFGHNSNVTIGGTIFHVQTEDRGTAIAVIDTTVHCHGRVMHRRKASYLDLLPLNADSEQALKLRLDEQHRAVMEELRSGALHLDPPQAPAAPPTSAAVATPAAKVDPAAAAQNSEIGLELMNVKTWLSGRHATMQIAVRHKNGGTPVAGAGICVRIDGAADRAEFSTETRANGDALLEFDMPRLTGDEPALVIEAMVGAARTQLRFQLRAKPKVPAAG